MIDIHVIYDIRIFRGADCDNDHYLLGIATEARSKIGRRKRGPKEDILNTEALRDAEYCAKFQVILFNRFSGRRGERWMGTTQKYSEDNSYGDSWKEEKKWPRKKLWPEECKRVKEEKRKYKILAEQYIQWKNQNKEMSISAKNTIRRAKRTHLEGTAQFLKMIWEIWWRTKRNGNKNGEIIFKTFSTALRQGEPDRVKRRGN